MPRSYSVTAPHYAGGLQTAAGPENLAPEQLTVAQNVRFTKDGGVRTRNGFEVKNAAVGTSAKIDNIHTHEAYGVMFLKSGTKIYQSLDGITWYDIGVTRTASEREAFWSKGKDVFATNKTDSFLRIAVSTLKNAITTVSTEIDVRTGDGDSFTNGAAVIFIEGDSINHTAVSTDQLTTVTNIAASHAAGTIITQTSTPSGAPKGSCIGELEGCLLVGGVSADPCILYYSGPSTAANPEYAYDFSANGAGTKLMPYDITGLGTITGGVLIGMKKGIHYADQFELDTGALITRSLSKVHPIPNAFCFAEGDKRTLAFTGTRALEIVADADGVRIIDDERNDQNNMDYPMRGELNALDPDQTLSFSHYDPAHAEFSFSVLKNGISEELVHQEDISKWSIDTGKVFSCKTNFGGRVFGGSDNADKVYLDSEGFTDDTIPILCRIVSGIYTVDDKRVTSEYLKMTFSGLLSGAGSFTFRIYVNGHLAINEPITVDDLVTKGLLSLSSGVPIGSGAVGPQTIGSSGSTAEAYAFVFPYEMLLAGETIQLEWEVFDEGTVFELRDSRLDAETENELYSDSF